MIYSTLPNMHECYKWRMGIHKAPPGWQQPWVVVFEHQSMGCWTRAEARQLWRER